MPSDTQPLHLASTHLRLRPDTSVETLTVDETFWMRLASGALGSFHDEYLVTLQRYAEAWSMSEMHPAGDEVVCLIDGAMDFELEEDAGTRIVALRGAGEFVIVPRGTWHTARPQPRATLLFITPGEGTRHRPAS